MTVIAINTVAAQRMSHVLPLVQAQVPAADEAYVWMGAVVTGLNRLFDPRFQFVAADFGSPTSADDTVDVTLQDGDSDRANSLAIALGVSVDLILSAALCTGMGKLAGDRARLLGPFAEI